MSTFFTWLLSHQWRVLSSIDHGSRRLLRLELPSDMEIHFWNLCWNLIIECKSKYSNKSWGCSTASCVMRTVVTNNLIIKIISLLYTLLLWEIPARKNVHNGRLPLRVQNPHKKTFWIKKESHYISVLKWRGGFGEGGGHETATQETHNPLFIASQVISAIYIWSRFWLLSVQYHRISLSLRPTNWTIFMLHWAEQNFYPSQEPDAHVANPSNSRS